MSIVIALLALSACPSFSARLKLPEPEEGFRPPMGGLFAGFKGLKKTNNLAALAEKNENQAFLAAPTAIEDAVFINCPQKNTLDEIFAARGAKLLLVDFFAFSCTNCIRAGKTIDDLHEKFKGHGLEVLAFARPEFKFEGEPDEVAAWIERNNVKYDVATDVKGTNWKNWKVTSWPTHFLVQKDKRSGHEGEYVVSYTKVGDRDSDQLYNEVIKILTPDGPRMAPMNSRGYTDVEIFLGDVHRKKNTGDGSCAKTKACKLEDPDAIDLAKAAGIPRPQGKITVYGTGYCPFCRMTKAMLTIADADFDYVDLADFGGPASGLALLKQEGLMPESHKTIPAVFNADGSFLGGFTETRGLYSYIDEQDIKDATPPASLPSKIDYKKMGSEATISIPDSEQWAAGKEGITALVDGAELHLSANLVNAGEGVTVYVVCGPSGSVQYGGELKQIKFSGRHYLKSYPSATPTEALQFSKGMKVYVLWLSAEPHTE